MRKSWRIAAAALFVAVLLLSGVAGNRLLALTDDAREALRLFTDLVQVAHDGYGREVTYRELVHASIQGMLRTLDPHTSFLSAEAYANMRDRQQSSFSGLGILVGMRNNRLTVITPIEGTPASRLGLRAGDHINTIEGESTETLGLDEAVRRLKGPKGTQVRITILRRGFDEPLEFIITRDEIPQNSVRYVYMMDEITGYVAISDFNRGTGQEVREAIERLRGEGMERLLVDLRGNGGGLLDQAIAVADLFLPSGAKIVETRGRTRDSFQEFYASDREPKLELPVVVLVSEGSASASEILAGAIQDHDIGLIVGTPTWGKGLVQTVYSLSYDNGLALTTAKYYTPSGRLIQRDYTSWFDYAQHPSLRNGGNGAPPGPGAPGPGVADEEPLTGQAEQTFLTDLGREVYGGGGITPDVVVQSADLDPFIQFLLSRSAFFDFAVEQVNRQPIESRDWRPSDQTVDAFKSWLVEREIADPEAAAEGLAANDNLETAERYLRAEVFNASFGLEARYQILAQGDPQIREAMGLFNQATELLARRQSLEEETPESGGRRTAALGGRAR